MTLNVGDLAPDFSLQDGAGNTVTLASLRGKRVVLYFYPKDNTPGCTKEACSFRDRYGEFEDQGIVVLGVSPDNKASHQKFTEKFALPFPLLCDPDNQVATAYDSYGPKTFMGRDYIGILRQTFVIGPDGRIEKIYHKVKTATHAADILQDLT